MLPDLRPYKPSDYDWLYSLREKSYRDVVVAQFGDWDKDLQRNLYQAGWNPRTIQIMELEGSPVGMLSTEVIDDVVWMREIQIEPNYQRMGIGTSLIRSIVASALEANRTVKLQVLLANDLAKSLYDRLGFTTLEITETHYVMSVA